ncbi:hypothetical protein IFM89_003772 [Coptis chinensis]|uniref:Isopenicillin N synthase-like Fe(2+) 2OG dioxygenase domain-containing protein n=1 Tax=Coptis chinensis TaxID=261450 RepID=A0A835IAH9_9MAGN|nr:hypothetical protein IFM89_003772 [Coptis chinensis]
MRDIASNFFKLPLGEKNKYAMANNDIQGKLEFWPMTPPELREAIETYSAGVNKVAQRLLGHLSLMMGLEKDVLLGMHKEVMQALHVNYYPPCSVPDHIWSNGKYKSIEHRAVTNKNKARISFASFITPNQEIEIEPLDQMVNYQHPVKFYKKIKYGDYLRGSLKEKMKGKAHTNVVNEEETVPRPNRVQDEAPLMRRNSTSTGATISPAATESKQQAF